MQDILHRGGGGPLGGVMQDDFVLHDWRGGGSWVTMQEQDEACKIAMLGNDVECAGLGCAAPTAGCTQDAPYYGASYAAPMASMQDASNHG